MTQNTLTVVKRDLDYNIAALNASLKHPWLSVLFPGTSNDSFAAGSLRNAISAGTILFAFHQIARVTGWGTPLENQLAMLAMVVFARHALTVSLKLFSSHLTYNVPESLLSIGRCGRKPAKDGHIFQSYIAWCFHANLFRVLVLALYVAPSSYIKNNPLKFDYLDDSPMQMYLALTLFVSTDILGVGTFSSYQGLRAEHAKLSDKASFFVTDKILHILQIGYFACQGAPYVSPLCWMLAMSSVPMALRLVARRVSFVDRNLALLGGMLWFSLKVSAYYKHFIISALCDFTRFTSNLIVLPHLLSSLPKKLQPYLYALLQNLTSFGTIAAYDGVLTHKAKVIHDRLYKERLRKQYELQQQEQPDQQTKKSKWITWEWVAAVAVSISAEITTTGVIWSFNPKLILANGIAITVKVMLSDDDAELRVSGSGGDAWSSKNTSFDEFLRLRSLDYQREQKKWHTAWSQRQYERAGSAVAWNSMFSRFQFGPLGASNFKSSESGSASSVANSMLLRNVRMEQEGPVLSSGMKTTALTRKLGGGGKQQLTTAEDGRYTSLSKEVNRSLKENQVNGEAGLLLYQYGDAGDLLQGKVECDLVNQKLKADGVVGSGVTSIMLDQHTEGVLGSASTQFNLLSTEFGGKGNIEYKAGKTKIDVDLAAGSMLAAALGDVEVSEFPFFGLLLRLRGKGSAGVGVKVQAGFGATVNIPKKSLKFHTNAGLFVGPGVSGALEVSARLDTELPERVSSCWEHTIDTDQTLQSILESGKTRLLEPWESDYLDNAIESSSAAAFVKGKCSLSS